MSIKARIAANVPPSSIRSKISSEFHGLVDDSRLRESVYTVIAFPGMKGSGTSIVDSKTLTKVIRKLKPNAPPAIVFAHNFTVEARVLLDEIGAIFYSTSDFLVG